MVLVQELLLLDHLMGVPDHLEDRGMAFEAGHKQEDEVLPDLVEVLILTLRLQ